MTSESPAPRARLRRRLLTRLVSMGALVVFTAALGFGLLSLRVGESGLLDLEPSEIAVRVDRLTGKTSVIESPGYHLFLPGIQAHYTLPKAPMEFILAGQEPGAGDRVPQLTVRSRDGSSYLFESMRIQYQVRPSAADVALAELGASGGKLSRWLEVYARAVLREEFGRHTAQEITDPAVLDAASERARSRLDDLLANHGLQVLQISTPKPKFDQAYEQAINARKLADQEIESVDPALGHLEKTREQLLAEVRKDKSIELEALKSSMRQQVLVAERVESESRAEADTYALKRVSDAEAEHQVLLAQASAMSETQVKEAEGLAAHVQALSPFGNVAVREQLVTHLSGVKFQLEPYSRDSNPSRVEHLKEIELEPGQ